MSASWEYIIRRTSVGSDRKEGAIANERQILRTKHVILNGFRAKEQRTTEEGCRSRRNETAEDGGGEGRMTGLKKYRSVQT